MCVSVQTITNKSCEMKPSATAFNGFAIDIIKST